MGRTQRPSKACIVKAGSTLALLIFIFFGFLNLAYSQLPLSSGAPYVGQKAPSSRCRTSMASRFHWRTC